MTIVGQATREKLLQFKEASSTSDCPVLSCPRPCLLKDATVGRYAQAQDGESVCSANDCRKLEC